MTTVYLVSEGSYSDYHVVGIFSERDTAQRYIDMVSGKYSDFEIEEFQLDELKPKIEQGFLHWNVFMAIDSADVLQIRKLNFCDGREDFEMREVRINLYPSINKLPPSYLMTNVCAKNEQDAAKIAMERRSIYLATKGESK